MNKLKREHVKTRFEHDGYAYYKTKKGILRKVKLYTTEKSIVITNSEFMAAWNGHFDLYYAWWWGGINLNQEDLIKEVIIKMIKNESSLLNRYKCKKEGINEYSVVGCEDGRLLISGSIDIVVNYLYGFLGFINEDDLFKEYKKDE